jgi:hypothetical protein
MYSEILGERKQTSLTSFIHRTLSGYPQAQTHEALFLSFARLRLVLPTIRFI